jgi:hemerythrin-like metal-binding protein
MSTHINNRFQHYMTGIAQIDAEHCELLELMSDLEHSPDLLLPEINNRINTIVEVFQLHLEHEEQHMHVIDYPFAGYHKAHHVEILTMLQEYGSTSPEIAAKYTTRRLSEHFITHIDHHDMQLAQYIKQYGKAID